MSALVRPAPPVVQRRSFLEASARERLSGLCDAGSLSEFCPPAERLASPHLATLGLSRAFDDGVVVASARLDGQPVLVAAQEGRFNGGSVGEVHGAKLVGLLQAALTLRPAAVLLLLDSGGVRLHEANAGILAISEVVRGMLAVRAAGIPLLVLLGGSCGAFGGMGIASRLAHRILMSEEARLSLSGPEVIETVKGKEEFNSRDRALVWRITGGKTRRALGEADLLVEDDIHAFRTGALQLLAGLAVASAAEGAAALGLAGLRQRQQALLARLQRFAGVRDGDAVLAQQAGMSSDAAALADAAQFELALHTVRQAAAAAAAATAVAMAPGVPAATHDTGAPAPLALQANQALDADDQAFADRLFGVGQHQLQVNGHFLAGVAHTGQGALAVVGTRDRAPIGLTLALAMAEAILAVVQHDDEAGIPAGAAARRPIVLLADTQGQALSRHEELLGLNGALAHLALCVDLARRSGHVLVTLVRHEAVSGGFLSFGMLGDQICALPEAQVRVMDLRAMARVTKLPLAQLEALAQTSATFAPGGVNFHRLGGIHALWSAEDDWSARLAQALLAAQPHDQRAALGLERGGRLLAQAVAQRVCAQALQAG